MATDLCVMGPSSLGLCFGDLRRLPEPGEELFCHELAIRPRQAALVAITARRLGASTSLLSPLAQDFPGRYLVQLLAAEGVVWEGPDAGSGTSAMRVDFGLTCETAVQVTQAPGAPGAVATAAAVVALPVSWLHAAPPGARLCALADGAAVPDSVGPGSLEVVLTTPTSAQAAAAAPDLESALTALTGVAGTVVVDMGVNGAVSVCGGTRDRIDAAPWSRHAPDIAHQLFCGAYLWAFVQGLSPRDCLRWAMLHASRGDVP